jgi:hypothetical protein
LSELEVGQKTTFFYGVFVRFSTRGKKYTTKTFCQKAEGIFFPLSFPPFDIFLTRFWRFSACCVLRTACCALRAAHCVCQLLRELGAVSQMPAYTSNDSDGI